MEKLKDCKRSLTRCNGAQEIVEVRKSWQANKEAIIFKFREKQSKPFLSSTGFYLVLLTFLASTTAAIIMHCTNIFDDTILNIIALRNGGMVYNMWKEPQMPCYIYLYPFNYTNAEEFLAGKEKAKLKEMGPFVFKERALMTDVKFDGQERLTYTENRTHEFMPELSVGELTDNIITPNIIYISAISELKERNMITQFSVNGVMMALQPKTFRSLSIEQLVMGEDDKFSLLIRKIQPSTQTREPFGLLTQRNGLGYDRITIGTGSLNNSNLGMVNMVNGKKEMPWNGPYCNAIEASDGTLVPTESAKSDMVYVLSLVICRRVPLYYKGETEANGFPTRRFEMPSNIYDNATRNPDNDCFCLKDCPPNGAFLVSPCFAGAPIAISYPHFLHGAEELRENFEGLSPDPDKHSFYVDVHELGVPLGGHTRIQLNLVIKHARFLNHLKTMKEGLVLPVAWLDVVFGEMEGVPRALLWHATYTAYYAKILLKWASLLGAFAAAYVLVLNYTAGKKPWC